MPAEPADTCITRPPQTGAAIVTQEIGPQVMVVADDGRRAGGTRLVSGWKTTSAVSEAASGAELI